MLCSICQQIPEWFFTKTFDPREEIIWQASEVNVVRHSPLIRILLNAEAACTLCQIMSSHVNMRFA